MSPLQSDRGMSTIVTRVRKWTLLGVASTLGLTTRSPITHHHHPAFRKPELVVKTAFSSNDTLHGRDGALPHQFVVID